MRQIKLSHINNAKHCGLFGINSFNLVPFMPPPKASCRGSEPLPVSCHMTCLSTPPSTGVRPVDPPFICFYYWDDLFPPEAQEVEPSKLLLSKSVRSLAAVFQQSLSEGLWVEPRSLGAVLPGPGVSLITCLCVLSAAQRLLCRRNVCLCANVTFK